MRQIQWEVWCDLENGDVFWWHPEDRAPSGNCLQISPANAEEIANRAKESTIQGALVRKVKEAERFVAQHYHPEISGNDIADQIEYGSTTLR